MATSSDDKPVLMKYKYLGKTGLKVSELCFGTMTLGKSGWGMPSEENDEKCFAMLDLFVAKGGNFIDTADAYGLGASEEVIGRWLATKDPSFRHQIVIATKCYLQMGKGPNDGGLSRKHILLAADASLRRLQTNYIDLYQVHVYDAGTPIEETLVALNDLVRAGKVNYIGCSNFKGYQVQKAVDTSRRLSLSRLVSLQPQYSLLCRSTEWELFPVCREEGLAVLPWSPLKGGWLTGKFVREDIEQKAKEEATATSSSSNSSSSSDATPSSRVAWAQKVGWSETNFDNFNNDFTWKLLDVIREIAKEVGRSMAQVSLRWVLQRPGVTAPIIGARTIEQLTDNMGVIEFELSASQMNRLNRASDQPLPYPYSVIKASNARQDRRRYLRE